MPIELVDHDPRWPEVYRGVAAELSRALGPVALTIEHVGSTAVPGLIAKPVIDVLVVVTAYDPQDRYAEPLETLGFVLDHRDEDHVFFRGEHAGTAVHVHVVEEGAPHARELVAFRDLLRSDPEESRTYAALKRRLAAVHDRTDDYAAAKTEHVRAAVARALPA